jgi:hypothetical protein
VSAVTASDSSDRQQAVVLDMLRRARGSPVSFVRLQEAGVEFPASVVFELELAGVAVARCRVDAGGARPSPAVRLDPGRDTANPSLGDRDDGYPAEPVTAQAPGDFAPSGVVLAGPSATSVRRWLPHGVLLILAAILAAGALLLTTAHPGSVARGGLQSHILSHPQSNASGSHRRGASSAHERSRRPTRSTRPARPAHIHSSRPRLLSPAQAWTLDIRGHDLLLARNYGAAITALRAAMAATGKRLLGCRQPTTETCLVYGYALYDIGQALLLGGHPAAAVPVFERRLLIDNQLPVVEAALTLARTRAA